MLRQVEQELSPIDCGSGKVQACDDCGTTANVEQVECPYADQVHDESVTAWLCVECYEKRRLNT